MKRKDARERKERSAGVAWVVGPGRGVGRLGWGLLLAGALFSGLDGAEQDAPTRSMAEVEAVGHEVRWRAGNAALAAEGWLDVTAAPYRADPSGRTDATAALRQAIKDARDARLIAFLPTGPAGARAMIDREQLERVEVNALQCVDRPLVNAEPPAAVRSTRPRGRSGPAGSDRRGLGGSTSCC